MSENDELLRCLERLAEAAARDFRVLGLVEARGRDHFVFSLKWHNYSNDYDGYDLLREYNGVFEVFCLNGLVVPPSVGERLFKAAECAMVHNLSCSLPCALEMILMEIAAQDRKEETV